MKRTHFALALLLSTSSMASAADKNSFDFFVWGKNVGTTTYTLDVSKGTTKVSSHVDRHDYPVPMTEEFRIASDGLVTSGFVSRPNDKFSAVYNPDKQHTKLDVLPSKNGEAQPALTWNLPRPDILIGLMEDSATWQMLMDAVIAHPHADKTYPLLIVGENNFTPDRIELGRLSDPVAAKVLSMESRSNCVTSYSPCPKDRWISTWMLTAGLCRPRSVATATSTFAQTLPSRTDFAPMVPQRTLFSNSFRPVAITPQSG